MEPHNFLIQQLVKMVEIIQKNNMDYAVTGGLAYSIIVEPRATTDIDILVMLEKDLSEVFFSSIEQSFDRVIIHKNPIELRNLRIQRIFGVKNNHEIVLDFLLAESEFHTSILNRAVEIKAFEVDIKIVSLEDLIILKKIADRKQDRLDIENIYAMYKDEIDSKYIDEWLTKLL